MTTIVPFGKEQPAEKPQTKRRAHYRFRASPHVTARILCPCLITGIEPQDSYNRACQIYSDTLGFLHTLKD